MANWFDDISDETDTSTSDTSSDESTFTSEDETSMSAGDGTFGVFGDTSSSDKSTFTTEDETDVTSSKLKDGLLSRIQNNIGKQKFRMLVLVFIGTLIIVAVFLFFGKDIKNSNTTKNKKVEQQVQERQSGKNQTSISTQQKQSLQVTSKNTDWVDIGDLSIETGSSYDSTFTIIEVHTFARNTTGQIAGIELRTELWGALDGFDGIYKIEVPYADKSIYTTGLRINVCYKLGLSDQTKVVYDLTIR